MPFDPYHQWLGIPPDEQPPNHYRLLGIALFEDNMGVIENAADQRMAHLRTFQAGKHSRESQWLLNEVAAARICLLRPEKKADYDRGLREQLALASKKAATLVSVPEPPPLVSTKLPTTPTASWQGSDNLGEYRLLEKLGEGGMGAVFKALHTKLNRIVALKILRKELLADPQAIARFDREMEAVGAVDDPTVVRAMDAREVGGVRLLAMEFVEGLDLTAIVAQCHPLAVADACELVRQSAMGLQCVHDHKLVHRDVKPSNLMLNRMGRVKLLDLGLAKFQAGQASQDVTGTDHTAGTLEYMAPECFSNDRSLDIRTDIYALGCTFFKLLVGQTPFAEAKSSAAMLAAHLHQTPPEVDRLRRDVPRELAQIVQRMLAKEPGRRYSSPGAVADALTPFCTGCDLKGLLARAEGFSAPLTVAQQAEIDTADTSFTQLLRLAGTELPRPHKRSGARRGRRSSMLWLLTGALTAVVVLIGAFVVDRPQRPQPTAPQATAIVFQWPLNQRVGAKLSVDGKETPLPADVSWCKPLEPGQHRLRFVRKGYMPYEITVQLGTGQSDEVKPSWVPESALVIVWPEYERHKAVVQVDNEAVELPSDGMLPGETRLPLAPGAHTICINREGFKPVARSFQFSSGKSQTLRPDWTPLPVDQTAANESALPKAGNTVVDEDREKEATAREVAKQQAAAEAKAREEAAQRALEEQRREQAYADAMKPVEDRAAAWDFTGAQQALADIRFDDAPPTARAAERSKELELLADFKTRIIEQINASDPPLDTRALNIRGMNRRITKADENGIVVMSGDEKMQRQAWSSVGNKAVPKLAKLVANPDAADDWVALGLLALVGRDPNSAGVCFKKAESLGAKVEPYQGPLAALTLANARELIAKGQFQEADVELAGIEEQYGATSWSRLNKDSISAARAKAKAGIREKDSEKLYAEAVQQCKDRELFELRALVERLRTDYADTPAVTDAAREPPFEKLANTVENLGKLISVSKKGKTDFSEIQAAIDASLPNSTIEIQDRGPYNEKIIVPANKVGLVLKGKRGVWPVITSGGVVRDFPRLVDVQAKDVTLNGLILTHLTPAGADASCVAGICSLRRCVVYTLPKSCAFNLRHAGQASLEACILLGQMSRGYYVVQDSCVINPEAQDASGNFTNVLFSAWFGTDNGSNKWEIKSCTLLSPVKFRAQPSFIVDSIVPSIEAPEPGTRIEYCCLYGKPPVEIKHAKAGQGCFSADPMFSNPAQLDCRLLKGSPCRGKASDGGDLGVRYTPEMIEMLKLAFRLRAEGLIKF